MADITLLTSKKETFSMVCAESLCCGTPIVGFKAGAPEQISLPEYSAFVEYGDIEALLEQMTTTLKTNYDKIEVSQKAKDIYSKQAMTYKYMKTYLNE
jgi:glycosyltransferase involved in cell wall biosynthesis